MIYRAHTSWTGVKFSAADDDEAIVIARKRMRQARRADLPLVVRRLRADGSWQRICGDAWKTTERSQ